MPKRGENIYKRKDGRWEGRYIRERTAARKAVYGYVYARSYKEVRAKLQNAVQKNGVLQKPGAQAEEQADFNMLTQAWFCHIKPLIKESTYMKYQNLWNSYICPKLGELHMEDLTQDVLDSCCRELLVSGGKNKKGLSAKTVADTVSLIRSIFRFYAGRGIPAPCDTRAVPIRQETKEMRVFSLDEQTALCSRIRSDPCMPNIGVLLCLFTGIRVGELCALKWEDISFAEKTLHVHKTMQRIQVEGAKNSGDGARTKIIVTAPKSPCSVRTIPLPEELVRILRSVSPSGSGYFLTCSDSRWIEPRTMQNHFKRLLKFCTIKDANYHALRHTFATRCVEKGFDVKCLSEILGHASVNITMNRYVHPTMQLKRENMQRLSDLFTVEEQA